MPVALQTQELASSRALSEAHSSGMRRFVLTRFFVETAQGNAALFAKRSSANRTSLRQSSREEGARWFRITFGRSSPDQLEGMKIQMIVNTNISEFGGET